MDINVAENRSTLRKDGQKHWNAPVVSSWFQDNDYYGKFYKEMQGSYVLPTFLS